MNPEFLRQTWLELTPVRRWGLPLVFVLLLVVEGAQPTAGVNWEGFEQLGVWLFGLFVLWGTLAAARSVTSEVAGLTWDFQRLAPHRPRDLLLGKLFGATIFQWTGALPSLILFAIADAVRSSPADAALDAAMLLVAALFAESLGLFYSLLAAGAMRGMRRPGRGVVGQVAVVFVVLPLLQIVGPASLQVYERGEHFVHWWWEVPPRPFMIASFAAFTAWALFGAHRAIRAELQESLRPEPWIGFLIFLTLYCAPWMPGKVIDRGWPAIFATGAFVCGAMFYAALFAEDKGVLRLRSLAAAWRRRELPAVWNELPLSFFALAGFAVALIGLGACWAGWGARAVLILGCRAGLFMLRDAALIHAVFLGAFGGRRPAWVVTFLLALLYLLGPAVLIAIGHAGRTALPLLVPFAPTGGASSLEIISWTGVLWAVPGCVAAWAIAWPRLRSALRQLP